MILNQANLINSTVSLDEVLNSGSPFDNELSRFEISNSMLQKIFDSRVQSSEEATNDNQESQNQNSVFTLAYVTQSLSEIPDKLDEPDLRLSLAVVMSCVTDLKKNSSD